MTKKIVKLEKGTSVLYSVHHYITVTVERSDGAKWLVTFPYVDRKDLRIKLNSLIGV